MKNQQEKTATQAKNLAKLEAKKAERAVAKASKTEAKTIAREASKLAKQQARQTARASAKVQYNTIEIDISKSMAMKRKGNIVSVRSLTKQGALKNLGNMKSIKLVGISGQQVKVVKRGKQMY